VAACVIPLLANWMERTARPGPLGMDGAFPLRPGWHTLHFEIAKKECILFIYFSRNRGNRIETLPRICINHIIFYRLRTNLQKMRRAFRYFRYLSRALDQFDVRILQCINASFISTLAIFFSFLAFSHRCPPLGPTKFGRQRKSIDQYPSKIGGHSARLRN